jgi:type II secretory pathway component GspD/PulD (secretin)
MALLKNIIVTAAALSLLASAALAQITSRTFHLTTVSPPAGMNELATVIRTLDANAIFADETSKTLTVSGTDAELALAAWLIGQLDSEHPQSASPQYTVAGSAQDAVRIFYLVNTPTQAGLNELVTSIRAVGDIHRIFTYSPPKAIAIRTTGAKAQLAEWLVQQLDVSPGNPPNGERYGFAGPEGSSEVVEVAYLTRERTPAGLNDAVTALRTATGIRHIFTRSTPQGIAFRGSADRVQTAERLLQQLDVQ